MKVAGALLAAGGSSRFGRAKAFVDFRGTSFLRRLAGELAAATSPVLVVAPPKAGAFALEVQGLGVRIVVNRLPARGMGSSIATAARALAQIAPDAEALLIALVDQPLADRAHFSRLVEAAGGAGWAASRYDGGVVGPPALFPREAFTRLAALGGDRGARELLAELPSGLALVDFPGGRFDVDTPADYERLLGAFDSSSRGAERK